LKAINCTSTDNQSHATKKNLKYKDAKKTNPNTQTSWNTQKNTKIKPKPNQKPSVKTSHIYLCPHINKHNYGTPYNTAKFW